LDNLAHTLAGAALGQAGLKRRTGLGMATLVIAANLPDIDVFGILFGENLAWRRGWTHGSLSVLVLPALLTGALIAFDGWQARRGVRPAGRLEVRPGRVLALGCIGVLSHLLLDYLNTYGIRFLMPFSERWFHGDALFIVDVWLWGVLGCGVWLSARGEKRSTAQPSRPALIALLLAVGYGGAMHAAGRVAGFHVRQELGAQGRSEPERVLAAPVLIDPFRRRILVETADGYVFGELLWRPGARLTLDPGIVPTNMSDPAVARAAAQHRAVADFLYWSRFPFAAIRQVSDGVEVVLGDARYSRRPGDGPFTIRAVVPVPGSHDPG
jgi:inner membrane protein